ncbi:MAG TPA: hypothetical protein VG223_00320, partial [Solirubrobacteraceae bacterium]|nr:hypothetical protein [Solirubrobacteraceae bacterium]
MTSQIGAGQGQVSGLSSALAGQSARLRTVNGAVAQLQGRITSVEAALANDRAQEATLRARRATVQARLTQLEAKQAHTEAVLSSQLVATYETPPPNLITVVLEASGFQDLLNRLDFVNRIGDEDAHVVAAVRASRRAVAAEAIQIGRLAVRQQALTDRVVGESNALNRDRSALVSKQLAALHARDRTAARLAAARGQVATLRRELSGLQSAAAI